MPDRAIIVAIFSEPRPTPRSPRTTTIRRPPNYALQSRSIDLSGSECFAIIISPCTALRPSMGYRRGRGQGVEASIDLALFKPYDPPSVPTSLHLHDQRMLRAYALGYLSSTGPRLLGFLRTLRRKDRTVEEKLKLLYVILKTSTELNRFPTSCAVIVGGSTVLPRLVNTVLKALASAVGRTYSVLDSTRYLKRLSLICTFLSALVAFDLLNHDAKWMRKRSLSRSSAQTDQTNLRINFDSPNQHHLPPPYHPHYAGKTIDFTLFALFRALDIVAITAWTRTRSQPWHPEHQAPRVANFVRKFMDPSIFATSAGIIMWSWFYSPHRLPRAYNHWINTAAAIDSRLIQTLRLARQGDFVYGKETGQAPLLTGLCKDLNLPEEYADPTKTIPIPCELYHTDAGPSCEVHALTRFWRSWKFAMEMYLPLQLIVRIRSFDLDSFISAIKGASQSSAFLAAFVSLFYYGVCLARTRLGPRLFSQKTVTPQMWDSGLCVLAGCMACGWSILLEKPSRRQEIAFFVAPRALATLLPRVYDKQYRRREQLVFASSVAVVMNGNARGVLGKIIAGVVKGT